MNESTNKAKLFFGGVPTAPDVERIVKAIGIPEPGLIPHSALEEIVGCGYRSARYRSVVSAWRTRLRKEHNIGTDAEPGEGIRVLTAKEWSERQSRQHRGAVRHAVRVHNEAVLVPVADLDDVTRRKHDHLLRATATLGQAAIESGTELRKALRSRSQNPKALLSGNEEKEAMS